MVYLDFQRFPVMSVTVSGWSSYDFDVCILVKWRRGCRCGRSRWWSRVRIHWSVRLFRMLVFIMINRLLMVLLLLLMGILGNLLLLFLVVVVLWLLLLLLLLEFMLRRAVWMNGLADLRILIVMILMMLLLLLLLLLFLLHIDFVVIGGVIVVLQSRPLRSWKRILLFF